MLHLIYATIAGLSTILSGLLPLSPTMAGRGTRYIVGFASGVVVAAALFEMLPESNISENFIFAGLGFFVFYLIERIIMIHTCGEKECIVEGMSWPSLVGISADNFVDGIAIAVGYFSNPSLGLIITLAVVAHEIPQGLTTTVIMKDGGYSLTKILLTLSVGAILYPFGAAASGWLSSTYYEIIVAFVAGEFIFIGAGELLPEAHKKLDVPVVISVILGAIMVGALKFLLQV